MSYVVLARKYRPRSFAQMVGQEHVVQALTNALQTGRLHHAYLFTGTRGIGKTTVSRILAKSLNCTGVDGSGGVTHAPCGVCTACTEIDADRYIDYIELDAASNRSIDEIRDLIERAAYKPGVGRFKVFMIDEAHQLTKDAFNALLKTLEEPPDYLKFVLATTDPDKMLPTVLSRCLQFNLRPMAPDTVREHLQRVLQAEQVPADDGALRLLARAARGSMRDGLSLTDQAIAYGGGQLSEDVVRTMLGSVDRSHARALVQALAQRDGAAVLAAVDGLRGLGLSAAGTLEELALLLQQMAIEQAVPGALDAHDPDSEDARRLAGVLAPDETQLLYSMALHGRGELSLLSDEYAALTMVLLRFLAFPAAATSAAAAPAAGGHGADLTAAPAAAAPAVAVQRDVRAAPLRAPSPPAMTLPTPPAALAAVARPAPRPLAEAPAPRPVVEGPAPRPVTEARVVAEGPPARHVAEGTPARHVAGGPPARHIAEGPPARHVAEGPPARHVAEGTPARPVASRPALLPHSVAVVAPMVAASATVAVSNPPAVAASAALIAAEPSSPPVAAAPPVSSALGDRWHALVRKLCDQGALTALSKELAMQGGLQAVDDSSTPPRWQLCVERETLRNPVLRDKLAAVLAAELGHAIVLDVGSGMPADTPAKRDAAERQRRQAAAEELIHNDPVVRELLSQFKTARIVPGSIKPVSLE